jgi:hypothetical protein
VTAISRGRVKVDSIFQYYGYNIPRDINRFRIGLSSSRGSCASTAFDYKGGGSLLDQTSNIQCAIEPARAHRTFTSLAIKREHCHAQNRRVRWASCGPISSGVSASVHGPWKCRLASRRWSGARRN